MGEKRHQLQLKFHFLIYLILIIAVCLIGFAIVCRNKSINHFKADNWKYIEYQVQSTDTYADIAEKNCPDNVPIKDYINNLIYINGKNISDNTFIIIFRLKENPNVNSK